MPVRKRTDVKTDKPFLAWWYDQPGSTKRHFKSFATEREARTYAARMERQVHDESMFPTRPR